MHAELGDAYTAAGMPMEAAGEYEHALALCPDFVDIRGKLAKALREIGDFDRAITEYEAILARNAAYVPARVSLGLVLFHAGRRPEAIAHWQKVLRLEPSHTTAASYLKMAGVEPRP
jgi:tetratricopeptide (TPR) repeat protein